MKVSELHRFLKQWRDLKKFPSSYGWAESLTLSSHVWSKLKDIQGYTKKDGHEYAVSLYYVDGEVIVTPYTRGTPEKVTTSHKVEVKYSPKDKNYYEKKVLVNSKVLHKNSIPSSKVPKKIELVYLFNVHTHPIQGEEYSFFSGTDIRSFLSSNALVMGLLTDQLWLVGKTEKALKTLGENGESMLTKISHMIFRGEKDINKLISENLKSWGLIFYRAPLSGTLKRTY